MIVKENVKSSYLIELLSKIKSSQLFWVLSFTTLTFLGAQVTIPTNLVPFTLQTMIVILSGAFLGARNGMLSQFVYVFAGAFGLPVFAGFSFGVDKLFGPTGGYLVAFPIAAYIVGYIVEKKKSNWFLLASLILGTLVILLSGSAYLSIFLNGNFNDALFSGAVIFSLWDILKISAAFSIYKAFAKKYPRLPK